jgi:hypothetical protein
LTTPTSLGLTNAGIFHFTLLSQPHHELMHLPWPPLTPLGTGGGKKGEIQNAWTNSNIDQFFATSKITLKSQGNPAKSN